MVFLVILTSSISQARSELYEVREVHYQMGTLLDITLYHSDPEVGKKILRRSVKEVHRLEEILSHYDPQSSLSMLNRQAGEGRVKIALELFHLLALAAEFSAKTSGYFDVTVGPLVDLWQRAEEKGIVPDSYTLAQTRDFVGYWNLKLYDPWQAELIRKGMKIDLGGIGKGYAVDRIVEIIKQDGVRRALINFGGSSIYALGSPPKRDSWEIGVMATNAKLIGVLHLKDQALSTSGSMGRYWTIGGKRYGHLINPKDGAPVTEPRMATVVAMTATEAEALTKPLIILRKNGIPLIQKFPRTEALLISESEGLQLSDEFAAKTLFRQVYTP